jgi:GNAT superfamily N-acetyltransferase
MDVEFVQARSNQAAIVAAILQEAARWAEQTHERLWLAEELELEVIQSEVAAGQFFLAVVAGTHAGTLRYQLEDQLFWPDAAAGEAAYVHRLAVRRRFAGRRLAAQMLAWAARRARAEGLAFLRLDTDFTRLKLRALYEGCGFKRHSKRQVGPYHVMRYELSLANLPDASWD